MTRRTLIDPDKPGHEVTICTRCNYQNDECRCLIAVEDAPADAKRWEILVNDGGLSLTIKTWNDAHATCESVTIERHGARIMSVTRSTEPDLFDE